MKHKDVIREKLTLEWIKDHAHIHLTGCALRWTLWAWKNIVILRIQESWAPDETEKYVNSISSLPAILSGKWGKVFFVFDISLMEFTEQDTSRYLPPNWLKTLDRTDTVISIVDENKTRLLSWQSLYTRIGKVDRINLFPDCNEALTWVYDKIIANEISHGKKD